MDIGTHEFINENITHLTAAAPTSTPTGGTNEDAARELEESVLGPSTKSQGKGKAKETHKRPASRGGSDDSSEEDIPISQTTAPPKKRRKVANDKAPDITADVERSIALDRASSASTPAQPAAVKALASGSGRGRGKQREQSVDSVAVSVSATPKQRKKPGPKKKQDVLPPQTQEVLGIGSAAPSVIGDATPVGSRPPSPALTNVSATFYELDEAIPALKKAKKIDDTAMWKRVRSLEEAQKKVWTNIARRDVVKVCKILFLEFLKILSCTFRRYTGITPKAISSRFSRTNALLPWQSCRLVDHMLGQRRE